MRVVEGDFFGGLLICEVGVQGEKESHSRISNMIEKKYR